MLRLASLALVLACALAALSCSDAEDAPKAQEPAAEKTEPDAPAADGPNVLFIVVDDLNDWVGVLGGHPQARTPNIDALAARGMLFTNAHCPAPACNPSRTAVLTGIRPTTSGVYRNSQPWQDSLPDAITLPRHFRRNGYQVMGAGKIFHRKHQDVDAWHEFRLKRKSPEPPPAVRDDPQNHAGGIQWAALDVADEEMDDHQVVDWCIERLGKSHGRPFFLACGILRPHLPWDVPRKYFDLFPLDGIQLPDVVENDLADVPEQGRKVALEYGDHAAMLASGNWKRAVQGYLASTAFADAQVGRLLAALDASEHAKNTIVVLWGDHGWHLGEKDHWRKFALWEEATRTPLIVFAPEATEPGTSSGQAVNLLDLPSTLTELCGIPALTAAEGVSLTPLLADPAAVRERPALITHWRGEHAVRSTRWRYIRYADGSEELYDHETDPSESTNLAGRPEHAATKADLGRWIPETEAPWGPDGSDRPTER